MSDIVNKLDEVNNAITGTESSTTYIDPTTDIMKKCDEVIDAINGVEPSTPYEYDRPDSDVMKKIDNIIDTIKENPSAEEADYLIKSKNDNIFLPTKISQIPFLTSTKDRDFEMEMDIVSVPSGTGENVIFAFSCGSVSGFFEINKNKFAIYTTNTSPQVRITDLGDAVTGKMKFKRIGTTYTWSIDNNVIWTGDFSVGSSTSGYFCIGGNNTAGVYTGTINNFKFNWLEE